MCEAKDAKNLADISVIVVDKNLPLKERRAELSNCHYELKPPPVVAILDCRHHGQHG